MPIVAPPLKKKRRPASPTAFPPLFVTVALTVNASFVVRLVVLGLGADTT